MSEIKTVQVCEIRRSDYGAIVKAVVSATQPREYIRYNFDLTAYGPTGQQLDVLIKSGWVDGLYLYHDEERDEYLLLCQPALVGWFVGTWQIVGQVRLGEIMDCSLIAQHGTSRTSRTSDTSRAWVQA